MIIIENNQPMQTAITCLIQDNQAYNKMIEIHEQARMRKNQTNALCSNVEDCNKSLNVNHNKIVNNMDNPVALLSQICDTMHLHQAMNQLENEENHGRTKKSQDAALMKTRTLKTRAKSQNNGKQD